MHTLQNGYTFSDLQRDLSVLRLPFRSIGKSLLGRDLYVLRLGIGEKQIFFNGVHHGLEWITAPLLVQFAADYTAALQARHRLAGYDVSALYQSASLYILPMVNPDGAEIACRGTQNKKILAACKTALPQKIWQSNGRGVDLNHNYNAGFADYKVIERLNGYTAGPTRFSGAYPESEPEVKAVCDFVRSMRFSLCIAFHAQGEVIYYDYNGQVPPRSHGIVKALAAESGYLPDRPEGAASYGGFKDWFILNFNKPAFTVEVGKGKNPLSGYLFPAIYRKNLPLMLLSAFLG